MIAFMQQGKNTCNYQIFHKNIFVRIYVPWALNKSVVCILMEKVTIFIIEKANKESKQCLLMFY